MEYLLATGAWKVRALFFTAVIFLCASRGIAQDDGSDQLVWWKKAIVYQIYPRSYMDSDGDGIGDIQGIISKLDYLVDLGIDCIWLSPIFPSPMRDTGYDLTEYEDIEPLFGTLQDFDTMLQEVHQRGLKLMLDFVPSYTSSDHPWFQKSVQREGKYTDYYIWHDGTVLANGTRAPPSNWLSVFGGSAWAWHPVRQQWYYHSFVVEQPNLNHRDPNVEFEMKSILRFWLDRGVDGFRVDAIQQLFVYSDYTADEPLSGKPGVTSYEFDYNVHLYTEDQPETVAAVTSYYDVLAEYELQDGKSRYMVIETYAPVDTRMQLYATGGQPFNFGLIMMGGNPTGYDIRDKVLEEYNNLPNDTWPNFVLGNHDQRRVSWKFGPQYSDMYNMLLLTLWGTPTTYYGEELGMLQADISWQETVDPFGCNFGPDRYQYVSRDPARTPMQWSDGYQAGFTTGNWTWLPLGNNYTTYNVKTEQDSPGLTSLQLYKQIARLRRRPAFQSGAFKLGTVDTNIFSYLREGTTEKYLVALNVGQQEVTTDFYLDAGEPTGQVVLFTPSVQGMAENQTVTLSSVTLAPGQGIVFQIHKEPDIVG